MKRAAINIPSELMERSANAASQRRVDVDTLAREALEEKVGEHRPRPRSLGMGASGFTGTARRAGEEPPVPRSFRGGTVDGYEVVALMEGLPERGLYRGQVGTVVEVLAPNVFEVEFSDNEGRAYALLPLEAEKPMILRHEPGEVA